MSDDPQAVIDETIEFIAVRRDGAGDGDGRLTGDTPDWFGDRLFGGVRRRAGHPRGGDARRVP